jgi:hypothetical protein
MDPSRKLFFSLPSPHFSAGAIECSKELKAIAIEIPSDVLESENVNPMEKGPIE